ncbi:4-hydroxybenzoate octaprenyltransferase [Dichotomicrobium thermohalophilum]|uniref:4-hydroxybenzoate octaprenyltransferase n=1 Tax=Dichotomicrobium thermohalophilum TaxID=933063 RepID=A0A397PNS2_9HYPH|nr:4-hydroxybenzoate octaprenyltransferase [Dichotomicrobium thermohalophilum]RIA47391.1 4-hydroxybenzoate polyprenyltransferase [Dichotomicrobium thermohalophilum]
MTQADTESVADAPRGNWVDSWAPAPTRPYLRMIRADRPIGTWLLLWPCWWSTALAAVAAGDRLPNLWYLALFAIGAFVMRGAGCVYNDIVDQDVDAAVARTRSRPLPSGQVSETAAKIFMLALAFTGFLVLIQFNPFTIVLGIASLGIVAVYPFMKRITHWPQAVLGLAFSWGALMGWAAVFGRLDLAPVLLYAACMAWTIGYDTIYAHQDKEDDALIGLKSTALKFGERTKPWMVLFYGLAIAGIAAAGLLAGSGPVFLVGLALGAAHLGWQIMTLDVNDGDNCLKRFRSNRDFGAIIFIALVAEAALSV